MQPRDELRRSLANLKARKFMASAPGATVLIGDSMAKRWPDDLAIPGQRLPIVNLGIGGDRVEDVLWRLQQSPLSERPPASVTLIAGTNNFVAGEQTQQILIRFRELVQTIRRQADCPLLTIGLIPRGKDLWYQKGTVSAVNEGIYIMSQELGFTAAFANDELLRFGGAEGARRYYTDRAHLNREGYVVVAAAVEAALQRRKSEDLWATIA